MTFLCMIPCFFNVYSLAWSSCLIFEVMPYVCLHIYLILNATPFLNVYIFNVKVYLLYKYMLHLDFHYELKLSNNF